MFGTLFGHFIFFSLLLFRIAALIRARQIEIYMCRYEYERTFEFQMQFLSRCILLCFKCSGRLNDRDDMRDATINAHSNRYYTACGWWNMNAPKMHDSLQLSCAKKRGKNRDPECDNRIESTTYLKCTTCIRVCDTRNSVQLWPRGYKWHHWVQLVYATSPDMKWLV